MAKYVYPAVMTREKTGYSVRFPDIDGCFTSGDDLKDALAMAEDVLQLMLMDMEDRGEQPKEATRPEEIRLGENEFTTMVKADTTKYRRETQKNSVRVSVSIPAWMEREAKEKRISFSKTLQNALLGKLE